MKTKISTPLVLFGLFWSAVTLLFDSAIFVSATRQVIAVNFPSTEGRMLSSEVTERNGGEDGTTYSVSLRYVYSVGGQEYTGTRYRYDNSGSSDSAWAHAVVNA